MYQTIEEALEKLTPAKGAVPENPGVYRFYDFKNNLLYVGKAKNLSNRLGNYFSNSGTLHGRMEEVLLNASRIDWIVTTNEKEALVLEALWIRRYQPRYNIKLLDTDAFGGVVVYDEIEIPKLSLWRGRRPKEGKSFGPFPGLKGKTMLDTLSQSFEVRSCKESIYKKAVKQQKPCLLGEVGKCKAPCLGEPNITEHKKQSKLLIDFLKKSDNSYLQILENDMNTLADNLQFERAAIKRDHLQALQKIITLQSANTDEVLNVEALAFYSQSDIGALCYLSVRKGEIKSIRVFASEIDLTLTPAQQLLQLLSVSLIEEGSNPLERCNKFVGNIKFTKDEVSLLSEVLAINKINYQNPRRGISAQILNLAEKNALESIGNIELKRSSKLTSRLQALTELKESLGMDIDINRIECIDISHTQGKQPVASIVTMLDGITQPKYYRRLFVPSELGGDDYSSIKYAVERRFTGNRCGLDALPDLLLIDGGPIQAKSASEILEPLLTGSEVKIKVVGLAKRLEELWIAGEDQPVILSRNSQGLVLCQRIRDEAHRWAIGGHRKERDKEAIKSSLSGIKGLGDAKKKALLKHFGSEVEIYRATQQDISNVVGIGPSLGEKIYLQLHEVK